MKRRSGRQPIATLPKATMSLTSFVSSLFSTVYSDAPAEEPKTEETPETPEEVVEEEEEPEPEDVSIPLAPGFSEFVTRYADRHESSSCIHRFGRNAKTVLSALRLRNTICTARRRSTMARVSRERIVLRNCKLPSEHKTKLVAEILVLQM